VRIYQPDLLVNRDCN